MWFPYNGVPGSDNEGFGVDMLRKVFAAQGYDVDYQLLPWKRALEDARVGLIDGVIGATIHEAAGFVIPEETLGPARMVLFSLKTNPWNYDGVGSLEQIRISAILGYDYGKTLNEYIEKNRHDPERVDMMGGVNAFEKNLFKLQRGTVDAIPANPVVFEAQVRLLGKDPGQFRKAGTLPEELPILVAFSPKVERAGTLKKIWDEGVRRIRREGVLAGILARYGVSDWKAPQSDLTAQSTAPSQTSQTAP
jgi:polar amino acid transport system substrate-binding protein